MVILSKMVRKSEVFPKIGNKSRFPNGKDCCHKCGKPRHLLKIIHFTSLNTNIMKNNVEKAVRKVWVPGKLKKELQLTM